VCSCAGVYTAFGIDPEFDTKLSNVTVIRGETATLPCAIDSLGKYKVITVNV